MTWLSGIGVVCLAVVMIKTTGVSSLQRKVGVGYSPSQKQYYEPSVKREIPSIEYNSLPTDVFYNYKDFEEPAEYTAEYFKKTPKGGQNKPRTPSFTGQKARIPSNLRSAAIAGSVGNQPGGPYEPQFQEPQYTPSGYGNPQRSQPSSQNPANVNGNRQYSQASSQNPANVYGNRQYSQTSRQNPANEYENREYSQATSQNPANGYENRQNSQFRNQNSADAFRNSQDSQYTPTGYERPQNTQYSSQPYPQTQTLQKLPADCLLCRLGRALVDTLEKTDLTQNSIANYLAQSMSPQSRGYTVILLENIKKLIEASFNPMRNDLGGAYGGGPSGGGISYGNGGMGLGNTAGNVYNGQGTSGGVYKTQGVNGERDDLGGAYGGGPSQGGMSQPAGYGGMGMGNMYGNNIGGHAIIGGKHQGKTQGLDGRMPGNQMGGSMTGNTIGVYGISDGNNQPGNLNNIENEDEMSDFDENGVNNGGLGNGGDTGLRSGLGNTGRADASSEYEDDDTSYDDGDDLQAALQDLKGKSPQGGSMPGNGRQDNGGSYGNGFQNNGAVGSGLQNNGALPDNGVREKRSASRYMP